MIALRAALIAAAVAAVVWLAVGIAASRSQDELRELVSDTDRPTAAQIARADELRRAAERTPGSRPALMEATLRMKGGDTTGARRVLEQVVQDEPDNGEAWLLLARATEDSDPARSDAAMARVRELAPQVPSP
jgi:predicted Zn-dependent protease